MFQFDQETNRYRFLIISLIVFVVLIGSTLFIILAYPRLFSPPEDSPTLQEFTPSPPVTATALSTITPSPTVTKTLRPTASPTITQTPTKTLSPSPTLIPSGPPTLVPAQPVEGDIYRLVEWTDENADYMIDLMDDYPNTLSEEARGENYQNYYDAFFYATIAQKEGLLRFPESNFVDTWRWRLAFDLAQIGDVGASEEYGQLITDALNQGDVDLANLSGWFEENEPHMSLYIIELEPLEGYLSSYLLDIRAKGSSYILLLESQGAFEYYVLSDLFDFVNDPQTRTLISDVTGDGSENIGIYFQYPEGPFVAIEPLVYDLSKLPPDQNSFRPSVPPFTVGMEFENYWGVEENVDGGKDLYFESIVYPPCPVTIRRDYHWEGVFFELINTTYNFDPDLDNLSYCDYLSEHAVNTWGYEPAIQLMEELLPYWPPEYDTEGNSYPPDAFNEWLYRLGVYHAQLGNLTSAIDYFNQVITSPGDPTSEWATQARTFLGIYKQPDDLYAACVSVLDCNANDALGYIINTSAKDQDNDTVEFLWQSGVPIRASGYFDFDLDGSKERWLTVQHRPLEVLDLWILADSKDGEKGIYVSTVDTDKPQFDYLNEKQAPPIVILDGQTAFRLERDPDTFEPYLEFPLVTDELPRPFDEGVNAAADALFNGADPDIVIDMLLDLQDYPGLLCEFNWTCDYYYYLLGLSYELALLDNKAVDTYLYLWWNYLKSQFTSMARLKLEGTVTPIPPTPTAVVTPSTMTPTPPSGITLTPTPTVIGPTPTTDPTQGTSVYPTPYP